MIIRMVLLIAGLIFVSAGMGIVPAVKLCGQDKRKVLLWAVAFGSICQWALFQLISIPFILKERPFTQVVYVYGICVLVWILGSVLYTCIQHKKTLRPVSEKPVWKQYGLWGIFFILLFFQLFQAGYLAYGDGDDAYYIGVASVTESSNTMYRVIPYTGQMTELDVRHGLAPFPVWIAFLSRISGCSVAVTAHSVLPLFLIPLSYLVYALWGSRIFKGKYGLPIFLIFLEVLTLWGNYSFYTAETFLLTRSRQGKAALAGIVLPFLLLLLFRIGERLEENKKIGAALWFMLAAGVTASCMCTTLGSFFSCLLIGLSGISMAATYKKYKILFPLALCCIPALVYFGIFVVLK